MATSEAGRIKVILGLDDSEYKSGLSGAVNKAETFADKVKSTFVGATVFKAASKGWDLISGSIGKATARLDSLQKSQKVMGVLTGSTEKATQIVNTLTDAVSDTAYGLDTVASSTQKLMTSGLGADKSAQYIKDLMDAVSFYGDGTNETLENVADGISKMNASQKISADQWQRLTDAGIPVLAIFAEKTGKSMDEVMTAFSKGKISASEFNDILMDALENGTQSFPAVAGAAKEMAGSFATSFANMQARVAIGMANVITSINTWLDKNNLPTLQTLIADTGTKFKEVLNMVAGLVPGILDGIQSAFQGLYDYFKPTIDAIVQAFNFLKRELTLAWWTIKDSIDPTIFGGIKDAIKNMAGAFKDWLPQAVESFADFAYGIIKDLPNIIEKIKELSPLIVAVAGAFATWKAVKTVSSIASAVGDAAKKVKTFAHLVKQGSGLIDGLAYAASSGTGVIASMAEAFTLAGGGLSGLGAAITAVASPVTIVIVAIGALVAAFLYLWNTSDEFRAFWTNVWNSIVETVSNIVDSIVQFFTQTLPQAFDSFIQTAQSVVDSIVNFFTVQVPNAFTNFITNMSMIPAKAAEYLLALLSSVASWASDMISKAIETGKQFLSNIINFFTQLPGNVMNFLSRVITNVINWVSQMISNAGKAGQQFLSNVVNFLTQLPGRVWSFLSQTISRASGFVGSFVSYAIQAGSQFFNGIVSQVGRIPSQMVSIGANIVNGIRQGIKSAWDSLTSWVGGLASGLVGKVKSALKIGSPSKEFANKVGKWIPAGITQGIEGAMPKAKAYMGRMSNDLLDAASMDDISTRLALENGSGVTGYGLGNTTVYNVDQTINSAKALRPSEIAAETERMMRRLAWV